MSKEHRLFALKSDLDMLADQFKELYRAYGLLDYMTRRAEQSYAEQAALAGQFKSMEKTLSEHSARFYEIDRKLEIHSSRFESIEGKLAEHSIHFDSIEKTLELHTSQIDLIAREVLDHSKRLDKIEQRLERIEDTLLLVVENLVLINKKLGVAGPFAKKRRKSAKN